MNRTGLTYYQAATDRYQDIKIKRLKKKYGCEGYAVYEYVQNEIYRVEGCFISFDEDQAFDCAEYWNLAEERVMEIIDFCADINLFDATVWKEQRILTSQVIQQKYAEICRRAKKRIVIPENIALGKDDAVRVPVCTAQEAPEAEEAQARIRQNAPTAPCRAVSQNPAELRGIPRNSDGNFDKEKKNKINPPSYSPQGGGPRKEEVQNIFSGLQEKFASSRPPLQDGARGQTPVPPQDGQPKRRNTDGLMYHLERYRIPQKEVEEILLLTGYGEIGHPVWTLFAEIDRSHGKITMPGKFLLSRLRAS